MTVEMVSIPGTELRVSRLCLGTMTFGSQADEAASLAMIDLAVDAGINFLDTANVYNRGISEQITGKALRGRREKIVLATKVRGKMGDGAEEQGLSRAAIVKQCEDSLRRLDTDYIDVYYLHAPDRTTPIEETLEVMDSLVKAGKVRYPAVSNYAAWEMVEMRWMAEKNGYRPMHVCQPMYNLLARPIETELLPMCHRFQVATFIYNPLAGGLLTGKQTGGEPLPGTRFDKNEMYLKRYWYGEQFDAVSELACAAAESGRSLISIALNWILHHTQATGLILGASQMRHLTANIAAAGEGPLTPEVVAICDQVWKKLRGVTPDYVR